MLKYLPSKFYFSSATESEFQYQLNKRSHRLATIVLYLAAIFLLSLTLLSLLNESSIDSFALNTIRVAMAVLAVAFIFLLKTKKTNYLHLHCFTYAILFCGLFSYLFWSFSQTYNELNEGGPMLVAATLVAIPMLHLGHKLILWSIIAISLIAIQLLSPVSILWSLYFYFAMVIAMGCIQYQLDILLRTQYRAELIEAEKAKTDQLTGIYNRHSFDAKCKSLIGQLEPSQYIALAMIDIDHFKQYNDNYGHLEGDRVLVKVAELLSNCDADIVVRFGGEEFILVKALQQEELNWLDDLPARFASVAIPHQYSSFKRITVSAGMVIAKYNEQQVLASTLLATADVAMYKAKSEGRDQILVEII